VYGFATVFTAGILLVYSACRTPCCEMLVHYCPHCGLRLLSWVKHTRSFFPGPVAALLSDAPPGTGSDPLLYDGRRVRYARSPFGPPPVSVDAAVLSSFAGRYAAEARRRVLSVDWKSGSRAVPTAFWDVARTRCLYSVSFPDFSPATKFHAKFLWPNRHDDKDVVPTAWKRQNASIVVVEGDQTADEGGRAVGMLQFAQLSWHVTFYLPVSKQDQGGSAVGRRRRVWGSGGGVDVIEVRKTLVVWPNGFYGAAPYWIWMSCDGPLLWTIREIRDAEDPKPKHKLVLLDGYDRLVASEDGPWSRFRKSGGSASRFKQWEQSSLYLYADFSERLVGEVVTSYVGLCGQIRRKKDWDAIRHGD